MNDAFGSFLRELPGLLTIQSNLLYHWFGVERQIHQPENVSVAEMPVDELLKSSLTKVLYNNVYITGGPEPIRDRGCSRSLAESLLLDCSSANNLPPAWVAASEVVREGSDGAALVDVGGLTVWCKKGTWRKSPAGAAVLTGNEDRFSQPGAYFALGGHASSDNVVRIYWNVSPEHMSVLVDVLTRNLPEANIPFNLKVFPGHRRCDAGVLYLNRCDWEAALDPITRSYEKVQPYMVNKTPFLTKALAPGLGVADDPGEGKSFGMTWMEALATALLSAYRAGRFTETSFESYASETLAKQGFSLREPHRFHEASQYSTLDVPPIPAPQGLRVTANSIDPEGAIELIASQLCEQATQTKDAANWQSTEISDDAPYGMLDQTLYGGAMGIALFLHEAATLLSDDRIGEVAVKAARAALLRATHTEIDRTSGSFYTGSLGTAITGMRIGRANEVDDLVELSDNLAHRVVNSVTEFDQDDLLGGRAGFILGALMLSQALSQPTFLAKAIEVGEYLLASRKQVGEEPGRAWADPRDQQKRPLLGLSHGTTGFAVALASLSIASGDVRFADAAAEALEHEDYWWDLTGSWPDFRGEGVFANQAPGHRNDMLGWCHGGAGVLIARATLNLLGLKSRADVMHSAEEQVRLDLTATGRIATRGSLCHGSAGNADCLLVALGNHVDSTISSAAQSIAAQIGAGAHEDLPRGLMVGQAGVGHFLLRTVDPTVPSVLLPSLSWLEVDDIEPKAKNNDR